MVTRRLEGIVHCGKDSAASVANQARFSVERLIGAFRLSTEVFVQTLHPQADAKDGDLSGESVHRVQRDPRTSGISGAWAYEDGPGWILPQRLQGDCVVAVDARDAPEPGKKLNQVVGKGIVIVDDKQFPGHEASLSLEPDILALTVYVL
jgi:hypothetical protein